MLTHRGGIPHAPSQGVHAAWNPPYFCRQAVEANVVDVINRFSDSLTVGSIKLPKVRALSGKAPKPAAPPLRHEAYPVSEGEPRPAATAVTTAATGTGGKKGL